MKFDFYNSGNDYPQYGYAKTPKPEPIKTNYAVVKVELDTSTALDIILDGVETADIDSVEVSLTQM